MKMEQIVVRGIAERLLFEAPDSDYRSSAFMTNRRRDVYRHRPWDETSCRDRLEIKGHWVQHKRYGRQLLPTAGAASSLNRSTASNASWERCRQGTGPARGPPRRRGFGKDTMKILERDPQRLLEVEGIGPKKLAVITESFYEEKQVNDIAYDLEQHGVAGRYAGRLLQKYGDDVHYVLTEEPYRMIAEIDGIGFKTADQMALAYGMDRQDRSASAPA